MEAPKCRLCGEKHWNRYPCSIKPAAKVSDAPAVEKEKAPAARVKLVDTVPTQKMKPDVVVAESKKPDPGKFDRAAYMRAYMQKKRAEKKGKLSVQDSAQDSVQDSVQT